MRRRAVSVLLAGVMTLGLAVTGLTGCGSSTDDGQEKIRLMVWSPQNDQSKDNGEWLQTMCETFAERHPEWDITFVYGVADEASAAGQVAQDPEASADVFMYANDTITTMTDANALAKFGGKYRDEIESINSQEVLHYRDTAAGQQADAQKQRKYDCCQLLHFVYLQYLSYTGKFRSSHPSPHRVSRRMSRA